MSRAPMHDANTYPSETVHEAAMERERLTELVRAQEEELTDLRVRAHLTERGALRGPLCAQGNAAGNAAPRPDNARRRTLRRALAACALYRAERLRRLLALRAAEARGGASAADRAALALWEAGCQRAEDAVAAWWSLALVAQPDPEPGATLVRGPMPAEALASASEFSPEPVRSWIGHLAAHLSARLAGEAPPLPDPAGAPEGDLAHDLVSVWSVELARATARTVGVVSSGDPVREAAHAAAWAMVEAGPACPRAGACHGPVANCAACGEPTLPCALPACAECAAGDRLPQAAALRAVLLAGVRHSRVEAVAYEASELGDLCAGAELAGNRGLAEVCWHASVGCAEAMDAVARVLLVRRRGDPERGVA
jgi:hypothetical protein